MTTSAELTRLWTAAFDETRVITVDGQHDRVERLIATLPFDPSLLRIDSCPPGYDCQREEAQSNHHIVVGNRHRRIVAAARRAGLKNVFVFEDDAEFVDPDPEQLARVLTWARLQAERWDVFYLGYLAPLLSTCAFVNRDIVKVHRPFHAHAICYSARIFDRILAIDFSTDHRPAPFKLIEQLAWKEGRKDPYFKEGVGSLDSWLSFSGAARFASHPILVVQTALPPGTAEGWTRWTGRPYDVRRTPRTLASIALTVYYLRAALLAAALVVAALWMYGC